MNSIGKRLRMTSWGESHQKAVGVVVDGLPSGIQIQEKDIQRELNRRKPGQSKISTTRKEEDQIEILSGLFKGKTTGAPFSALVYNKDVDSSSYEKIKNTPRPGHADYTYGRKYRFYDYRGGGRSSGRETVSRVIAGAIARKIISKKEIKVAAHVTQIGNVKLEREASFQEVIEKNEDNPVRCVDPEKAKEMISLIEKLAEEKDSTGGVVEVIAKNVPAGLGEPVFGKLDADLAHAMMGIPAVKAVEFGQGFDSVNMKGSQHNDELRIKEGIEFLTNNAGGILGGISTGEEIRIKLAVKPTASIGKKQKTVDLEKKQDAEIEIGGRHDPNIAPRIPPVAEAMMAFTLADHLMYSGRIVEEGK